ncbi:MAG: YHS domain-containing protein [Gemmatimonadales bacterium]|nr:YHS domain-containing protein [Gemmatimonadales bacterium]
MEFPVDKAVAEVRHEGKTYYFCAQACRRDFERDPSRCVGAAHGSAVSS